MTLATYKWTLEHYHKVINAGLFDDQPIELLKGELVLMAPQGEPHADRSTKSNSYLIRLLGDQAEVRVGCPITLPNQSEPEPDLAIVQALDYGQHHPYPEDIFWLVEFSNSSLAKDLGAKVEIYAEAEIAEYWVVNLKDREVVVFRDPRNGNYGSKQTHQDGAIAPLAFPDLTMPIAVLLGGNPPL